MKLKILTIILTISLLVFTACKETLKEEQEQEQEEIQEQEEQEMQIRSSYAFTATDLYGNLVTEELNEKDVYFIHYWATWCSPCVNEMPELSEIAEQYQDRVGFIGLVGDYDTNLDGAVNIVENAGIPEIFIMIDANEPSIQNLLNLVNTGYLPTTVILVEGENGLESAFEPIVGAKGAEYADYLDEVLDKQ